MSSNTKEDFLMPTIANNTYYKQLDTLDPMEQVLYRILKNFTNNNTHDCYPSIALLSQLFKRCRNTTKKYLRTLQGKGFINIKQQRVTHAVTNNKYNDTNLYTLLLEKFNKAVPTNNNVDTNNVIELKETRLDTITSKLKSVYDNDVVVAALRTMRNNIRNGSIINNMNNYLESLINTSNNQLEQVNNVIENSVKTSKDTSSNKHKVDKTTSNKIKTRFHNFEQRTSNYSAKELEDKILNKHKRK